MARLTRNELADITRAVSASLACQGIVEATYGPDEDWDLLLADVQSLLTAELGTPSLRSGNT